MDSSSLKGTELGKLVLTSGLLDSSWGKISEIQKPSHQDKDSAPGFKIYQEAKFTFVVFSSPPISRNGSAPTPVSGPDSKATNPFHFLCSETNPSFSLHTPAFELFNQNLPHLKSKLLIEPEKPVIITGSNTSALPISRNGSSTSASTPVPDPESKVKTIPHLKSKFLSEKPVIITGAALGGSVASLFTLWLLETIDPKLPRPLCITFGSPFVGDAELQKILENSVSNSCFLHVADAAQTPITEGFKPFGTYLIFNESECVCIEDPEVVMELLKGVDSDLVVDYGKILYRLNKSVLSMADSGLISDDTIKRMKERAAKKLRFDPFNKLDHMKIQLAHIEWYKKETKKVKICYYDQYYRPQIPNLAIANMKVEALKKELNGFWKSAVEDAKKKPQSDISILKRRFLFAGNNYRRMMEPLDIAEYYREGGIQYQTSAEGRSSHYVMLEKWFGNASKKPDRCKNRDLSDLLTFDSCFWAEVEEALIVIKQLKTDEGMRDEALIGKLVRFEKYVWEMVGKREVSPEIFLESSFMKWWQEYKEIKGRRDGFDSSTSDFTEFMNTGKYESYGKPESDSRA